MSTMQERANELDAEEAIAIAGMVLHDRVGPVPSTAFDHPGRRAWVAHWERIGRVGLTLDDRKSVESAAGEEATTEALQDTDASIGLAQVQTRLREANASLMARRNVTEAEHSLAKVTRDYERGNLSEAVVAEAYQRLHDAKSRSGRMMQDTGDFLTILDGVVDALKDTHARGWLGLRLPSFKALDAKLCGLRGLMLLGAAPGVGKTQLTLQLGMDAMNGDPGVGLVYLSLEMSKRELGTRLLCLASDLRYRRLRMGDHAVAPGADGLKFSTLERKMLADGQAVLRNLQPRLKLFGSEDVGALAAGEGDPSRWYVPLSTMVEDAKRRMGVARALVVVDNLQAIAVESPYGRPWASDMDRDRVVIEGLTRLQHDTDDAVMVVSEVAKGKFKDTNEMAAILGTGRNTYRADAVMLLKRRSDDDPSDRFVDLIVDKGRDGMDRGKVALEWDGHFMRLSESTEQPK